MTQYWISWFTIKINSVRVMYKEISIVVDFLIIKSQYKRKARRVIANDNQRIIRGKFVSFSLKFQSSIEFSYPIVPCCLQPAFICTNTIRDDSL